uniref:MADF domain-containing protein n=1 Tax=Heligmosomoides polygyrus TaxID=6339 RepID=A0A8L8Q3S7_HELPZ
LSRVHRTSIVVVTVEDRPLIANHFHSMPYWTFYVLIDNDLFQISAEDIRSQWKNLKDTFVRKLRWVSEGKYTDDPLKEPTWKFYRMLSFLDDKESKRLSNDHPIFDIAMPFQSYSAAEDKPTPQLDSPPSPALPPVSSAEATGTDGMGAKSNGTYTHSMDEEEEPRRKRVSRRSQQIF